MSKFAVLLAALLAVFSFGHGRAAPPIEAYGALPEIRSMALSPDGEHVAYLYFRDGAETLIVYHLEKGAVAAAPMNDDKARSVSFVGPDHVILVASDTRAMRGFIGRMEYSAAFSFDFKNNKIKQLLKGEEELFPAQSGLGRIIGISPDGKHVFMPGFSGYGENPPYSLFKVNLKTGGARMVERGLNSVTDWFVDSEGRSFLREEYNNKRNSYKIFHRQSPNWKALLEVEAPRPPYTLMGVKADGSGLFLTGEADDIGALTAYELSFDGVLSQPILQHDNNDLISILIDRQRRVLGVQYSGFYPTYDFFDKELGEVVGSIQQNFADASVYLTSWSSDFQKLLFYVAGGGFSGNYYIFDRENNTAKFIANARPQIKSEDLGAVLTIQYKARDGLTIPAVLTMPANGTDQNAPLIVLPHGGPEAYDSVTFDWIAQYFANRGYMVLQPNFRGSYGFGLEFRNAGRGEWGGKMQDDITDGVRALIRSGRVDPNRICIVGGSYGGYAALAGGAFTPDLYQCVAAIAPVTDLPMMLARERKDFGERHWVYDYWKELIGDPRAERERLKAISPANAAEAFQAPVLLIHGRDDLVVPIRQSARMEAALKRAGKEVELIRLKGEDHNLSTAETRLQTLKALDAFVDAYIGAD